MMTDTAPAVAPRRVLLIKAQGQFKHSGKYYLHNGRWHALHQDKPAPKGAPVAAHKHAAGQYVPKQHFTDDEWKQLELPAENTNAGSFNKLLAQLKQYSDAGDVTAILGMQFGTNTYGKKGAAVANHLLDLYGSEHKVSAGQKAGEHAAVQQAPEAPAPKPQAPAEPEPVGPSITELQSSGHLAKPESASGLSMPAFVEGKTTKSVVAYYQKQAQGIIDLAAAGDAKMLAAVKHLGLQPNKKGKVSNTWAGKTQNSKLLLALHEQALAQAKGNATADQPAPAVSAEPVPAPAAQAAEQLHNTDNLAKIEGAAGLTTATMFAQLHQHANGNSEKSKAEAEAALEKFKAKNDAELAKLKEKPATPAPAATSKLSQIPWDSQLLPDSNTNAKSHNGKVAQIKAMAEAGDLAGLEAFKAGKNTYGQKQMKLAALAVAALKEDGAAPEPAASPAPAAPSLLAGRAADQVIGKAKNDFGDDPGAIQLTAADWLTANPGAWDELAQALVAHGHPEVAAAMDLPMPEEDDGPQEGDTKPGADGMLVFKNGRWHKQTGAEADPAGQQHPIDALDMPNLSDLNNPKKVAELLEFLKQKVKAEGPSALNGVTKKMKATGKLITKLPTPEGLAYKITGYEGAAAKSHNAVFHYVESLKEAAGKPKKAPAKPKAAAPVIGANGIEAMDGWKQTGPQGGSNPGGKFKDQNGVEWYCKFPGDEDVAKSEVLAAQLYAIAGVAGQDAKLITKDGKLGIASKWTTVKKASPADLAKTDGVLSGFGVDAWLGNWDVVGLGFDNLQVNEQGKAMRVDAGGSLTYRAQGGKKAFGTTVLEIDSLRDAKINPQAAAVFGKMTQADITAAVAKVLAIPDSAIINAVELHGPGDAANKKALADVLLARKADLAAKFPKAVKPPKKRLDPHNLPVDPTRLPKAHDFNNWLGTGNPLSSQPHVNAANMAVEQEMLALANTGNLVKLKDFKFHAIDKATGNATGQMIPIAQHPSKHVQQLHADLVMTLDEIANPPEPLKVFQETDVGTIEQLAAALPPKKFGTTVNAVKSNEKLGFWVVLGTAHGAQKFKPAKVMDYGQAAIAAAYDKFKQASKLAKHFISSVQASGSYNDLFRDGKTHDHAGNKLSDVAQAALEHATSMPEGTSVYRWQNMPDDMVKKIMAAPDGTVLQATGPMCTSYSPNATSGFGQHRVTIRYAKGAKGVESFASGSFKGEKEVTTLPNARFVVLSKQMVPNEKNPAKHRLELELLMLPPDLGL